MEHDNPDKCYDEARKLAIKAYNKKVSSGENGYLPSLEGLISNTQIVSEMTLGIIEIPLKKIIGTYSHSRSLAFGSNFMPLLPFTSEFKKKWTALCSAHLNEGIRHSIKVYEYLNWFYVIEGNKRVSVLKYFDAYAIWGSVVRLIPQWDENNEEIKLYYEFMKFNKITNIFSIWLTKEGNYLYLLELLENYSPDYSKYDSKYKYFERNIYDVFRKIYLELGGQKLPLTTGDAFIEYSKIYGISETIDEEKLKLTLSEFMKELELISRNETADIQTTPEKASTSVISAITSFVMPSKKLKVAFAYARTIEDSGWTNSHEIGRRYIDNVLSDQVTTSYIENVPENEDSYEYIKSLAEEGNDIIFTTSPIYLNSTMKCALEYPNIRFFNCSEYQPYMHIASYYGRTYEPRFLTGIIGGSITNTNILGYIATSPTPEVISSINAFALGAKMVNPYAKVKVYYTKEWNSRLKIKDATEKLKALGADIVSNKNLPQPNPISKEFGVFSMMCKIDDTCPIEKTFIAAPLWNWGLFYEKILKDILDGSLRTIGDLFSNGNKLINFWWGIATGVLDIFYIKDNIPNETEKLVDLMKKMITDNGYHPFTGPIYDIEGNLRIEKDEIASHEDILAMDWYVDNVEIQCDPIDKELCK